MNVHADFVSIFSGQWPVLKLLPLHLAVMLVHLLPYLEQITASLAKTGECMSIPDRGACPPEERRQMRDRGASRSCPPVRPVPFGRHDGGGEPFCRRHIPAAGNRPPVRPENGDLFPGAANNRILNALMELFLPSDKEIQVRYIIQQEDARFRLGTPDGQCAYLGISTYL